jgi:hypothetical protein
MALVKRNESALPKAQQPALNNPNILTICEIGVNEEQNYNGGFVDGATLRTRLGGGALTACYVAGD